MCYFQKIFVALSTLVCIGVCTTAAAKGGVNYTVDSPVQTTEGNPQLRIRPNTGIKKGSVEVFRGDKLVKTKSLDGLSTGETLSLTLEQPEGTSRYRAVIRGTSRDGELKMSFEFEAKKVEPIEVEIDKDAVSLKKGRLRLVTNRPLEKAKVVVSTKSGKQVGSHTQKLEGQRRRVKLEWPGNEKADRLKLKVWDTAGFWQTFELRHFWVRVPHEQVSFGFGEAKIESTEASKLKSTLQMIRKKMAEHESMMLDMNLYIAGYTDTVGSKSENRKLSRHRARAIGDWFDEHGLDIDIYYQGFGEEVLAVGTPDETRNKKNRRAIYILGSKKPPKSDAIPASNWTQLD